MFPSLSRATPTEYRAVNWLNWGMVTTVTQTREWSGVRASQVVLVVKNSPTNAGEARDMGLIPGLRRSPAEGNDQMVKNLAVMMETQVWSLGRKDPLEITPLENHPSILAWKVPITEVPGGLQSTGLQRVVGHKWTTNTWHLFILKRFTSREGNLIYNAVASEASSDCMWSAGTKIAPQPLQMKWMAEPLCPCSSLSLTTSRPIGRTEPGLLLSRHEGNPHWVQSCGLA